MTVEKDYEEVSKWAECFEDYIRLNSFETNTGSLVININKVLEGIGHYNRCEEYEKQIRDMVIDELTQEVEFEEKWLFDCYAEMGCRYTRRDVNLAFSGIKHYLKQLKGE